MWLIARIGYIVIGRYTSKWRQADMVQMDAFSHHLYSLRFGLYFIFNASYRPKVLSSISAP